MTAAAQMSGLEEAQTIARYTISRRGRAASSVKMVAMATAQNLRGGRQEQSDHGGNPERFGVGRMEDHEF